MQCDILNCQTIKLTSTFAPYGVNSKYAYNYAKWYYIYRCIYIDDSDKSYRPDQDNNSEHQSHRPELNTRVDMQSVQQDTTSVAKVPVTIPGVVDSENATRQDSRCKGFSNHSDYWKRVTSFGTASADLIIPVDDELVSRKNSCRRRTHQETLIYA